MQQICIFILASLARDLISKMLVIDPDRRISVDEALKYPYANYFYDPKEFTESPLPIYNTSIEHMKLSMEEWKRMFSQFYYFI